MANEPKATEPEIKQAITELLGKDLDVTARAVAKLVGVAPTTITRNEARREAVEKGAADQIALRAIAAADKTSRETLLARIALRDQQIADLERRITILTASHRAMLMAVGQFGGIASWQKFFGTYEAIREELHLLHAIPDSWISSDDDGSAALGTAWLRNDRTQQVAKIPRNGSDETDNL